MRFPSAVLKIVDLFTTFIRCALLSSLLLRGKKVRSTYETRLIVEKRGEETLKMRGDVKNV